MFSFDITAFHMSTTSTKHIKPLTDKNYNTYLVTILT